MRSRAAEKPTTHGSTLVVAIVVCLYFLLLRTIPVLAYALGFSAAKSIGSTASWFTIGSTQSLFIIDISSPYDPVLAATSNLTSTLLTLIVAIGSAYMVFKLMMAGKMREAGYAAVCAIIIIVVTQIIFGSVFSYGG